jgi:large subunit ribosomal protein L35
MPKMKTHSGAKKRFKLNSGGTILKRARQNKNHILNKKSRERKRIARHGDYVSESQVKAIATLVQAGGGVRGKRAARHQSKRVHGAKRERRFATPEVTINEGGNK